MNNISENDRPSKQDLSTHIVPSVAYIWKALGNALLPCDLVEREELCIIEANNPGNVKECCEEMFDKWLKADKDASWRQLIKALQQPGVELNYLADDIKNKLQKRECGPFERSVMLYVVPSVGNKWKALGEVLLSYDPAKINKLNIIEANHQGNNKESCKNMFMIWIETGGDVSWKKLLNALQDPSVKLDNLAADVKKKLQKREKELDDRVLKGIAERLPDIGDNMEKLCIYLNVNKNTAEYDDKSVDDDSKKMFQVVSVLKAWREKSSLDASRSELMHIITVFKESQSIAESIFSLLEHDRPPITDLFIHVVPSAATRWKPLGEVLLDPDLVGKGELEMIQTSNPQDVVEWCKQMFIKWLRTSKEASWNQLLQVLESPGIQLNNLAHQIKNTLQEKKISESNQPLQTDLLTIVAPFVAVKWKDIGEMLLESNLVDNGELKMIQTNSPRHMTERCKQMFARWLETTIDASWSKIIDALQSQNIQLNYLADQIKKMLQERNLMELNRPSLKDLNSLVIPFVALRWKDVGEVLLNSDLVNNGELEIIQTNNPQYVTECCKEMFIRWLKTNKDASWKQVIEALQYPGIHLNYIASQIKENLQKRGLSENSKPLREDLSTLVVPLVAVKWKALGKILLNPDLVTNGELEMIQKNNPQDITECCKEMFRRWLKANKHASWKQLIEKLESPSVQLNYLANNIKMMLQERAFRNVGDEALDSTLNICDGFVGEDAAHDIATVISYKNNLQILNLEKNNLKTGGITKIAKVLQNISTLTVFNIGCNDIEWYGADDIAAVIHQNTQLQELYLHNNLLRTEGIIRIAKALQNISTLTLFTIGDNGVGESAAERIAAVLSRNTKLKELYLHNNFFGTQGIITIVRAMKNISALEKFSIGANEIKEEAADDVAKLLSHNANLIELYLHNNFFKTEGMIKIIKALQNISSLKKFSIGANDTGKEAADVIAPLLSHNNDLIEVYFHNNILSTQGMIKIANGLQNVSNLTKFSIGDNKVGEEAADHLASFLCNNTKLMELYLHSNHIGTKGMIKIAKALQNISSLTIFGIGDTNVGEEAADDIATVVARNPKLTELHLYNNKFQTAGAIKITRALRNTITLAKYNIARNNIESEGISIIIDMLRWNNTLNLTYK